MHNLAYIITPHGFGHASRSCAVMNAISKKCPDCHFHIFTTVPKWFFVDSLNTTFEYHSFLTDIGLIQNNAMEEDINSTLSALGNFLPFDREQLHPIIAALYNSKIEAVFCDTAALGIAVAEQVGIPSVLIENFTWDWIYAGYPQFERGFSPFINYLQQIYQRADYHFSAAPHCQNFEHITALVNPICRQPKQPASAIREALNIPSNSKVVLITMGGIPEFYPFIPQLQKHSDTFFIIPGSHTQSTPESNVILLPHHSKFFHPDLMNICDAVIGKIGYSTIAEAYYAGIPFGFIKREYFRESKILSSFILDNMNGIEILHDDFLTGSWLKILPDLSDKPRLIRNHPNGADQISEYVTNQILASSPI
jgi:UDP:flavonoid glycosyltransferase YjiC (YdhE family)